MNNVSKVIALIAISFGITAVADSNVFECHSNMNPEASVQFTPGSYGIGILGGEGHSAQLAGTLDGKIKLHEVMDWPQFDKSGDLTVVRAENDSRKNNIAVVYISSSNGSYRKLTVTKKVDGINLVTEFNCK